MKKDKFNVPLYRKGQLLRIKGTQIEGRVVVMDMDNRLYMLDVLDLPMQAEHELEKVEIIGDNEL